MKPDTPTIMLFWVKAEIDHALKIVRERIAAHIASPGDIAALASCPAQIHQVSGALRIFELEGACRFAETLEAAFSLVSSTGRLERSTAELLDRAALALGDFVEGLSKGALNAPLSLYPLYCELSSVLGHKKPSRKDLFFPDLAIEPPPHPARHSISGEQLPHVLKSARTRYQRGLLSWLRNPKSENGLPEMRRALEALDAASLHLPEPRVLWWVAVGLIDGLSHGARPEWAAMAKSLCSKLDFQIRNLAAGARQLDRQLLRELLYILLCVRPVAPRIREIRRHFCLDGLLPASDQSGAPEVDADWLRASLTEVQTRLETIKSTWVEYASGNPLRLARFRELVTALKAKAQELSSNHLVRLLDVVEIVSSRLPEPYPRNSQLMIMEMASAFLLAESIVEQFPEVPADLDQQVVIMNGWLLDAANTKAPTEPPAGLRSDLIQQYNEGQLRAQVATEMLTNLRQAEEVLDAFARDPSRRDTLPALKSGFRQIHGALGMLGYARASDLLAACEKMIDAASAPDEDDILKDINWIAEGLSSLGIYLEPCLSGRPPSERILDRFLSRLADRDKGTVAEATVPPVRVPAAITHADSAPAVIPETRDQPENAPDTLEAQAAVPEAQNADASPGVGGDTAMLEIFREEAVEVLESIRAAHERIAGQQDDLDSLTVIRRGFHTLKGSGRMVGLIELGEAAWALEQVLNQWLEQGRSATPPLLALIEVAHASFASWIPQLETIPVTADATSELIHAANRLKDDNSEIDALPRAKPAPPPSPAAESQEAELDIGGVRMSRSLYDIYVKEAQEHLVTLQSEASGSGASGFSTHSKTFSRAAHTLASISRTAGLPPVAELAGALESWLTRAAGHGTSASSEASVSAAISRLQEMVASIANQQLPAPAIAEIGDLSQQVTRSATTTDPSPPENAVQSPEMATQDGSPPTETAPLPAEQRVIRDDIDPQLLPVFLEEALQLVPTIGTDLREWRAKPADTEICHALQRGLHTLKGSARMAGAMRIGELTHLMESAIESAAAIESSDVGLFDQLEAQLDRLSRDIERLQPAAPAPETPPSSESVAPPSGNAPANAESPAAKPLNPAVSMRIAADALDRMINQAGEVSIARSRIETELRTVKQSLSDLTDSVTRLRSQLRETELQADRQMQSRLSLVDSERQDFDPLEFDRYTRLQELTRMMAESLHDVATIQQNLLRTLDETDAAIQHQARSNRDLQQSLMRVRTVPFARLSERMHRIVRQTARELGKRANLEISGAQTELDRGILEKIAAPLEHLLRNAVAHGLETPEARTQQHKSEAGSIRLALRQDGDEIEIVVNDDGAGFNFEKLRSKGVAMGLLNPDATTSDAELAELIFTPGFSTADDVTELAGRGIGMDVVRSEVLSVGGRIETSSTRRHGTAFTIYLPLTLAVTQAVLVRGGQHMMAVPAAMIEQVLRLKGDAYAHIRDTGNAEFQGHSYPLHQLASLTGSDAPTADAQQYRSVLLLRSGSQRLALEVDELSRNQEVVIKNVGPQLSGIPWISGATVLADGTIALLINPVLLGDRASTPRDVPQPQPQTPAAETVLSRIAMVVDDSLTVRKITSRLLERQGFRVLTAKDGLDALEQIASVLPDIMLVDIEMPRMDGFDLARNIRANPTTATVPIVMISSRTAEKHKTHAMELGVNAFIGKPYQEADLLQAVNHHMNRPAHASPVYH